MKACYGVKGWAVHMSVKVKKTKALLKRANKIRSDLKMTTISEPGGATRKGNTVAASSGSSGKTRSDTRGATRNGDEQTRGATRNGDKQTNETGGALRESLTVITIFKTCRSFNICGYSFKGHFDRLCPILQLILEKANTKKKTKEDTPEPKPPNHPLNNPGTVPTHPMSEDTDLGDSDEELSDRPDEEGGLIYEINMEGKDGEFVQSVTKGIENMKITEGEYFVAIATPEEEHITKIIEQLAIAPNLINYVPRLQRASNFIRCFKCSQATKLECPRFLADGAHTQDLAGKQTHKKTNLDSKKTLK
jgi:hypothetical protein